MSHIIHPTESKHEAGAGAKRLKRSEGAHAECGELLKGDLTSNRSPSKVNNKPTPVTMLASGVDSLVLSFYVKWSTDDFFKLLAQSKEAAQIDNCETPISLILSGSSQSIPMVVYPSGLRGYEWRLQGNAFSLRVGNWLEPKTRPSVMVEFRSEYLWNEGVATAIQTAMQALIAQGAEILLIKTSRIDLCVDLLFPQEYWNQDLLDLAITHATTDHSNRCHKNFTGFTLGSGHMKARLYDKELEIQTKSKKYWMYDIWGIDQVPEDQRAIRVEFQIRRNTLKEMAIDTIDDTLRALGNIWAYCTHNWLKFQTKGKHHTQRQTLRWWKQVQSGFLGIQDAFPAVRSRSVDLDIRQLSAQAIGILTSLMVIDRNLPHGEVGIERLEPFLRHYIPPAIYEYLDLDTLESDLSRKRAKYRRTQAKHNYANWIRENHGLPHEREKYS